MQVPLAPLVLCECATCGLVQLEVTVERGLLFNEKYPYRSGTNNTVREHLKGVVEQASSLVRLEANEVVLDIGYNDGTLLYEWPHKVRAVGFDPAGQWLFDEMYDFQEPFSARGFSAHMWNGNIPAKAKVVTSIAMFYDLDYPQAFVNDIAKVLAPDGVWINEFNYLGAMVKNHAYDMIGHEHLCYYRLSDMTTLAAAGGLEVVHAETNAMNGGSLRVVVKHRGSGARDGTVDALLREEAESEPRTGWWIEACKELAKRLLDVVRFQYGEGKHIWVRGASTRGLTMLHKAGIARYIEGAGDRNPEKWGCYIPGTGIQIRSEAEANAEADYQLLLPYSYLDEILGRSKEFLARGGKFIIPVPEVRLVP